MMKLPFISAADPVVVTIGGPRKVEAKITTLDGEYRIDLRMVAVKAFDNATNDSINRDKARLLALQALILHVSGKKEAEATISGVRVLATGADKQFYTLTLAVPKNKFSLVQGPAAADKPLIKNSSPGKPDAGVERLKWKSNLFTKKIDFQRTIDLLKEQFQADIEKAEKFGTYLECLIAEIEERATTAFKAIRAEISSEILLLSVEMEDLTAKAKQAEIQVMDQLKKAVERKELEEKKNKEKEDSR